MAGSVTSLGTIWLIKRETDRHRRFASRHHVFENEEVRVLNKFMRRSLIVVLAFFLIGLFLVDSSAQRRRRKHRTRRPSAPRITNPAIYQPSPSDESSTNTNSSSEGI